MKVYRFLTGPDDAAFCHRVTDALNKGWELHGAPSLSFNAATNQMHCGQAVVKTVHGKDYDPSMKLGEQ
ncbi:MULTISPECIES: DUF1737 domain-containing protein [Rhizobiaceae]|jgi:hypothetical protein|uniref:DUF1737 domain-containing protein n=2 Tax=Rhizobiaceae TaxID=82115 RepID=A0A376AB59_9HYPH|nr:MULTISPECIES: DUF1737 domain-containing protein [Rhizobiaceae]MBC7152616.1 DUF1737 domain-containing protein [Rhizobium sp.]MBW8298038.1 DUF1737 domain-containing protein [Hydrogenophaga sp.]MBW8447345.1 DUF1737 domain-containing protein [Arenimonas sp.]PPJ48926.1 DUF1737 domain-containing protein [Rhizobium sp. KAs_5_22]MBC7312592.1 DUF1737 domain-containing protein [Rhizobium sp.]